MADDRLLPLPALALLLPRRPRARGDRRPAGGEGHLQAGAAHAHLRRGRHAARRQGAPRLEAEVPPAGHRPRRPRQGPARQPAAAPLPHQPGARLGGDHRRPGGGGGDLGRARARLPARRLGRGARHRRGRGRARRPSPVGLRPGAGRPGPPRRRSRRSSATPTRRSAASSSASPPTWSARRSSGARTACRCSRRTSRALPARRPAYGSCRHAARAVTGPDVGLCPHRQ